MKHDIPLKYDILGPMQVSAGRVDITPSAPKLRQVLALLLLRCDTLVQTGEIIDELWGEHPPRSALSTLQTYIYKLRKGLLEYRGDAEEWLVTKPSGYILRVSPEDLDLRRFDSMAGDGAAALDNGDPQRASAILARALSMWRGPALADVAAGGLLSAYATRLEESRMRALQLRIEADLQAGRHHQLVGELMMLTATYPLHEDLHANLMLALYRCGRRYEALNTYRRLREVLIEELGLEPSPALTRIHQAVLSSDPLLDPRPREVVAEIPRDTPPPCMPTQLPPDTVTFTGRQDEVATIENYLLAGDGQGRVGGVVAVTGMPAIGKTTLAVRLAYRLGDSFPDGQLLAALGGSDTAPASAEDVIGQLLIASGVPSARIPAQLEERAWLWHATCRRRRFLVVLDDAESMAQIRPLLPVGPGCAILITSRRRLDPDGLVVALDPLPLDQGLEMLARLTGAHRVTDDKEAAERVVQLCGGLPLAIQAAGSRLAASPGMPMRNLGCELDGHQAPLDLLRFGSHDVRARYHSAYHRLSELDRYTLRLITLFRRNSFTASDVAPLLGQRTESAELILSRLGEHHLLRVVSVDAGGMARYAMHEMTRLYARERLEDTLDAAEQAEERHRDSLRDGRPAAQQRWHTSAAS